MGVRRRSDTGRDSAGVTGGHLTPSLRQPTGDAVRRGSLGGAAVSGVPAPAAAASALAIYGIAFGVDAVRRAIRFHPLAIAGFGLLLSCLAGLISIFFAVPFMTGLWVYPVLAGVEVPLSSVMLFDLGVYFVVLGAVASIALALEERELD